MKDLIINYWSQIVILIGAIGYLLKLFFNFVIKKKEIKFTIFQKLRNEEVKSFYISFLEFEEILKQYNARAFNGYNLDERFYDKLELSYKNLILDFSSLKLISNKKHFEEIDNYLNKLFEVKSRTSISDNDLRVGFDTKESSKRLDEDYNYLKEDFISLKKNIVNILRQINGID